MKLDPKAKIGIEGPKFTKRNRKRRIAKKKKKKSELRKVQKERGGTAGETEDNRASGQKTAGKSRASPRRAGYRKRIGEKTSKIFWKKKRGTELYVWAEYARIGK